MGMAGTVAVAATVVNAKPTFVLRGVSSVRRGDQAVHPAQLRPRAAERQRPVRRSRWKSSPRREDDDRD